MPDIFSLLLSLILLGHSLNVFSIYFEVKDKSNVAKSVISLNLVASVSKYSLICQFGLILNFDYLTYMFSELRMIELEIELYWLKT